REAFFPGLNNRNPRSSTAVRDVYLRRKAEELAVAFHYLGAANSPACLYQELCDFASGSKSIRGIRMAFHKDDFRRPLGHLPNDCKKLLTIDFARSDLPL